MKPCQLTLTAFALFFASACLMATKRPGGRETLGGLMRKGISQDLLLLNLIDREASAPLKELNGQRRPKRQQKAQATGSTRRLKDVTTDPPTLAYLGIRKDDLSNFNSDDSVPFDSESAKQMSAELLQKFKGDVKQVFRRLGNLRKQVLRKIKKRAREEAEKKKEETRNKGEA